MSTTTQLMSAADMVKTTVMDRLNAGKQLPVNDLIEELRQRHDVRAVRTGISDLVSTGRARLAPGNILVAA